jgi:hypothetical protein
VSSIWRPSDFFAEDCLFLPKIWKFCKKMTTNSKISPKSIFWWFLKFDFFSKNYVKRYKCKKNCEKLSRKRVSSLTQTRFHRKKGYVNEWVILTKPACHPISRMRGSKYTIFEVFRRCSIGRRWVLLNFRGATGGAGVVPCTRSGELFAIMNEWMNEIFVKSFLDFVRDRVLLIFLQE